jgi:ubiquinone biosynthesis protein
VSSETRRTAEVAAVLVRHGFASLVELLEMNFLVPGVLTPAPSRPRPAPIHLRRALEELGPTFMKLGQVLSTRPDLVPPTLESELSLLQDAAPTVRFGDIEATVERALGQSLGEVFDRFDRTPLAAASIGQVHAATLPDGRDVVVKVRRPRVADQVDVDLALLAKLAAIAARNQTLARRYDPVGLAREFAQTLRAELDYLREGRNADLVAAGFVGDDRVHIPAVCWEQTRVDVLTEERVHGIKVDDLQALDAAGLDLPTVARTFVDAYLTMVFVHGFFHADPHPGNVFVEQAERIGFVDFGMVGSVSAHIARGLSAILLALVGCDAARMTHGLLRLGIAIEDIDRAALERDLAALLTRHAGRPLEELRVGPLLAEVMAIVRAHQLHLPSELALLLKTVMMCEGVAAQLDPNFELLPRLVPYAARPANADEHTA